MVRSAATRSSYDGLNHWPCFVQHCKAINSRWGPPISKQFKPAEQSVHGYFTKKCTKTINTATHLLRFCRYNCGTHLRRPVQSFCADARGILFETKKQSEISIFLAMKNIRRAGTSGSNRSTHLCTRRMPRRGVATEMLGTSPVKFPLLAVVIHIQPCLI